jgi:hypothetical protein
MYIFLSDFAGLLSFGFITFIFATNMQAQDDLQTRWWNLEARLAERFGKKPDMEAILFLIGVQELGDIREKFSKEQKQDLMHVAVCSLFAQSGYYELEKVDEDGWPHFKQLKVLPIMNMMEQESFMKDHILLYFESNELSEP